MMCRRVCLFAILTSPLLVGCVSSNDTRSAERVRAASLVQVLVDPKAYAGAKLEVHGYLACQINLKLYLSADHAMMKDSLSAVPVGEPSATGIVSEACCDQYARIRGDWIQFQNREYALLPEVIALFNEHGEERRCWPGGWSAAASFHRRVGAIINASGP